MAATAVLVHCDGLHSCATRFRFVAFGAFSCALALGRDNSIFGEMRFVIEAKVGSICIQRILQNPVLDLPVDLAIPGINRQ